MTGPDLAEIKARWLREHRARRDLCCDECGAQGRAQSPGGLPPGWRVGYDRMLGGRVLCWREPRTW